MKDGLNVIMCGFKSVTEIDVPQYSTVLYYKTLILKRKFV